MLDNLYSILCYNFAQTVVRIFIRGHTHESSMLFAMRVRSACILMALKIVFEGVSREYISDRNVSGTVFMYSRVQQIG